MLNIKKITFRIGSRNETPNYYGITHVIRSMVGFSTQKCSGFAIVRNMQQNGLYFTCVGDREVTAFNVVGARDKIISGLKYLAAAATAPMFKPWQVRDNLPRLYYDLGCLTPHAKLMDNLHRACFRTGLGNSLFINKEYIGDHTPAMVSSENYLKVKFNFQFLKK